MNADDDTAAASQTPAIQAEDVHQSFSIGDHTVDVLRGVNLSVSAGEKLFLCGASGAGKTTLLYTLAGLEHPKSGRILVNGTSVYDRPGTALARLRNQHMGYVFQNYLLLPELTALENVRLPSMIHTRSGESAATEILEKVGLGHRLHHLPAELSGGEQQRAAIARALINNPDILFADEPTGNLDSKNGAEIMSLLLNLADEQHKTLVVVTHDANLARTGDRVLHIVDGLIEE
ncbi:MAG: ABC transporter ATP-binding protein [Verrucomicrobiota bacterium]